MELTYGVQTYAWGKVGKASMVGQLKAAADKKFVIKDDDRYAEMWIGTHPKCESECDTGRLSAMFGGADGEAYFTKEHVEKFGADMPYLLKVLSIDKALSIQAHPTLEHAKELHARDPKNYPDPNHKPELLVAITPVKALACFRTRADIAAQVSRHPETLSEVVLGPEGKEVPLKVDLKLMMARLLAPEAGAAAMRHEEYLKDKRDGELTAEDAMFLHVASQFPGDSGALMIYVLNLITLAPGEAVFLKPNEPHAYLQGDGVEIMAKSDNVVRAGLTPKFKDAETLLKMMSYDPEVLKEMALPYNPNSAVCMYRPPAAVPEFQLGMVKLGGAFDKKNKYSTHSVSAMLVVKGCVKYNGMTCDDEKCVMQNGKASAGQVILFPPSSSLELSAEDFVSDIIVDIDADAVVFFAETNDIKS